MDIYDITVKEANGAKLDIVLVPGQKVRIVRMVTIVYDVNISEVLDNTDDTTITLEELISDETDNNDVSVILEFNGKVDIEDSPVISVEIL